MRRSVCVAVATPGCCIAQCKGIRISESGKILLVESGILGFGIWYTANGIRHPSNDCNPESKLHWQRIEHSSWKPESTEWNPKSKPVSYILTLGELQLKKQKRVLYFLEFYMRPFVDLQANKHPLLSSTPS